VQALARGEVMFISHVAIRNFRALADIDCDLSPRINVIVGPNAVGKTTILQAIRLAKALTGPRTQQESSQVLFSLSAASPHFPQRLFLNSLVRDFAQPVEIRCTYVLSEGEIATLQRVRLELVQSIVAARFGQGFSNPATVIQILQSPQGQQAMAAVTSEINEALTHLERDKSVVVGITMSTTTGQITLANPLAGSLIGFLDQRLPPSTSIFSYFPADRALPMGEVNLQVGGPDAQQQLESHNSQPQIKYSRLKNLVVNSLVIGETDRDTVRSEFEKIFSGLLKGRRIKTININQLGLLSVMTEDVTTGRQIELDSLSSGEKNIALTFLIIARSVAEGGIALFDEPELHLNPAVSRDVLPFMMDQYSKKRNIQFIMCTHSPEILSGAYRDEDCTLLHLKSPSDITPVGKRAVDEYSEALHRLGTSVSESFFYDGTVLVEGDSDVIFLEEGFPEIFKKYKIKDRGGRRDVERTAAEIQELERKGERVAPIYFIFDQDDEPTKLENSTAVKVLQWPKRCVENYMIDVPVIAELLKDPSVTRKPIASAGDVSRLLRDLAFQQLEEIAARQTYNSYGYLNSSLTKAELSDGGLSELASAFFTRMSKARASLPDMPRDTWIQEFLQAAEARKHNLLLGWEAKWRDLCDGKKLISDLHKKADLKVSEAAFKARITRMMRDATSDNWRLVRDILRDFIKPLA
jgi:predicted ATPase